MRTPSEILNELQTKRANNPRLLSEYDNLLDEIEELLESESLNENARGEAASGDPTIQNQLDLPLEAPPEPGEIRYEFKLPPQVL